MLSNVVHLEGLGNTAAGGNPGRRRLPSNGGDSETGPGTGVSVEDGGDLWWWDAPSVWYAVDISGREVGASMAVSLSGECTRENSTGLGTHVRGRAGWGITRRFVDKVLIERSIVVGAEARGLGIMLGRLLEAGKSGHTQARDSRLVYKSASVHVTLILSV